MFVVLPQLIDVACSVQSVLTVSLSNERTSICLGTAHTFRQRTRVDDILLTDERIRFEQERNNLEVDCTWNDVGETVTPAWPLRSGSLAPSGNRKLKTCKSDVKKRKSSALASTSPRQTRRPTPNGIKYSGLMILVPSALRNRSGLNNSGSFHRVGSMWTA